jgi:KDO2-lipid IV(A) lauroyltransferase
MARAIGWVLRQVNAESADVIRANLRQCFPDCSPQETEQLMERRLVHMALLFFEFAHLRYWNTDRLLQQIKAINGGDMLTQALRNPQGVLLLVPHFGNWEILCAHLGHHYKLGALYDPPKLRGLEAAIIAARQRHNGRMFRIDAGGMRGLLKFMGQGKVVAVLPDQVPDRSAGVYVPFFGQPALTMTLTHRLISKHNPTVLLGSVRRSNLAEGLAYTISFEALPETVYSADPETCVATINTEIERVVRQAPEQYQWEYKRFKRPPGALGTNIYRRQ